MIQLQNSGIPKQYQPRPAALPNPNATISRDDDFVIAAVTAMKAGNTADVESAVRNMKQNPGQFSHTLEMANAYLRRAYEPAFDMEA